MKYQPYTPNTELKQISSDIENIKKQVKTQKCPFCQTEILQKDKICYACHKRIPNPPKNSPVKKILINILLIALAIVWTVFCFTGIIKNYEKYGLDDYIIVFFVFLFPFAIYFFVKWSDKKNKQKYKNFYSSNTVTSVSYGEYVSQQTANQAKEQTQQSSNQASSALSPKEESHNEANDNIKTITVNDNMIETSTDTEKTLNNNQNVFSDDHFSNNGTPLWISRNEKPQSIPQPNYIKVDNIYQRTDEKPISDEDIPNLINIGYQQSIETDQNNITGNTFSDEEQIFFNSVYECFKNAGLNPNLIKTSRLSSGMFNVDYVTEGYVGKVQISTSKESYCIMKQGAKRATKVFDNLSEAKQFINEKSDYSIEHIESRHIYFMQYFIGQKVHDDYFSSLQELIDTIPRWAKYVKYMKRN